MLERLPRVGRLFLLGILLGAMLCIWFKIFLGPAHGAILGYLSTRAEMMPSNPPLFALAIFLNNSLVVLLASVAPTGGLLFILWGRRRISLWKRIDQSRISDFLDKYVWGFVERLRPDFERVKGRHCRDSFVIAYGLPVLVLVLNGGVIGYLFALYSLEFSLPGAWLFIKWVAPHGVIEVPVILMAAAMGYSLADGLLDPLYRGNPDDLKEKAKGQVKGNRTIIYLCVLLSFLAIAAFVEVYLTPVLAG